eukprot:CAMPEP_0204182264 /NCGR_PEP_ID=MMETSP0361-20130328/52616_1 /ASSEMBLY_ACC=CAM_ASM_000343 /TAXON_ID=268821 /ORGANISM="Scrippsiella Hangoei, Strain SHTV-5" /LENGTH=125 /DNA_ID=CAMNT_0051141969 /DNA_START=28 /DNA_END=401 /DNA_ORIENTATION=+
MGMSRDLPGMECWLTLDEFGMSPRRAQKTPSVPTMDHSLMMDHLVAKLNAWIVQQDAPLILGSLAFQFGPSVGARFPLTRQLAPVALGGLGEAPLARQFAPFSLGVGTSSAAEHLTRQFAPLTLG